MELFAVGGIVMWLAGRQAGGAATLVVGLATKISSAVVLPFMVLGSDRRLRVLIAAGATALALFALWLGVFGTGALRGFGGAIGQQQELFSQRSIPQQLGVLFDLGSRPQGIRFPLTVLLIGWVLWLLYGPGRGRTGSPAPAGRRSACWSPPPGCCRGTCAGCCPWPRWARTAGSASPPWSRRCT